MPCGFIQKKKKQFSTIFIEHVKKFSVCNTDFAFNSTSLVVLPCCNEEVILIKLTNTPSLICFMHEIENERTKEKEIFPFFFFNFMQSIWSTTSTTFVMCIRIEFEAIIMATRNLNRCRTQNFIQISRIKARTNENRTFIHEKKQALNHCGCGWNSNVEMLCVCEGKHIRMCIYIWNRWFHVYLP